MVAALDRRQIALLIPSTNTTVERDAKRLGLVSTDTSSADIYRLPLFPSSQGPAAIAEMNSHIEDAMRDASSGGAAVAGYFCTTGSFFEGPTYETELKEQIERSCSTIAVTAARSTVFALRAMGLRELVVLSPYIEWINLRLARYYEAVGFSIRTIYRDTDAADSGFKGINDRSPESILDAAQEASRHTSDGVLVPCTAWRSMEVVAELEYIFQRPVVTVNQATFWATLRAAGASEKLDGLASLGSR